MEPSSTGPTCQALQRAPMSRTLFWLASLPLSLPTWMLLVAWSNCANLLRRMLRQPSAQASTGGHIAVNAEAQTDMNMTQLERFIILSDLNEEAVAALIDHQQQLERNRQETGTLQNELRSADDCVALMKQCIADLENRNVRLQNTLADVVLPLLDQLVCQAEAASSHAALDSTAVQRLSQQLLGALLCTRQVLAEAEAADVASGDSSPLQKHTSGGREEVEEGKKPAATQGATVPLSRLIAADDSAEGIAKVLSFGPPTRVAALVHVLADDV